MLAHRSWTLFTSFFCTILYFYHYIAKKTSQTSTFLTLKFNFFSWKYFFLLYIFFPSCEEEDRKRERERKHKNKTHTRQIRKERQSRQRIQTLLKSIESKAKALANVPRAGQRREGKEGKSGRQARREHMQDVVGWCVVLHWLFDRLSVYLTVCLTNRQSLSSFTFHVELNWVECWENGNGWILFWLFVEVWLLLLLLLDGMMTGFHWRVWSTS